MCPFGVCSFLEYIFPVIFIVSSNIISSNLEYIPTSLSHIHIHIYTMHNRNVRFSCVMVAVACRPYACRVYARCRHVCETTLVFRYFHLYVYECVNVVSAFDYNNQQTHTFFVMLRIFFYYIVLKSKSMQTSACTWEWLSECVSERARKKKKKRWIKKRHYTTRDEWWSIYTRILMIYISMVCE